MAEVLRGLGANVELDGDTVRITSPDEPKYDADFAAVRQFRASVCVLGPLVGRCKRAKVALPGGDAIGSRPLDMHQAGLRQLGARCNIEHGCVVAEADHLRGAEIQLEFPVGGRDREHPDGGGGRRGCHHDPQRRARTGRRRPVHDAQPDGRADRGRRLVDHDDHRCRSAASHRAPGDRRPDRRRTWAHCRGHDPRRHLGQGVDPEHLQFVLDKLARAGAEVTQTDDGFRVVQYERPKPSTSSTLPFPGFPPTCSRWPWRWPSIADGTAMITENVFEARFMFCRRDDPAGCRRQHRRPSRGGPRPAAAVRARRCGPPTSGRAPGWSGRPGRRGRHRGRTRFYHIDRGYPLFVEHLVSLGAEIERVI